MVKVNYQREKRRKDLDRQRKQEEKRTRKLTKDLALEAPGTVPGSPGRAGRSGQPGTAGLQRLMAGGRPPLQPGKDC